MFSLTSTSRTPAVEFPAELSNSGTSSTLPVSFICCSLKNHFIVLYEEKSSMDQYTLLRWFFFPHSRRHQRFVIIFFKYLREEHIIWLLDKGAVVPNDVLSPSLGKLPKKFSSLPAISRNWSFSPDASRTSEGTVGIFPKINSPPFDAILRPQSWEVDSSQSSVKRFQYNSPPNARRAEISKTAHTDHRSSSSLESGHAKEFYSPVCAEGIRWQSSASHYEKRPRILTTPTGHSYKVSSSKDSTDSVLDIGISSDRNRVNSLTSSCGHRSSMWSEWMKNFKLDYKVRQTHLDQICSWQIVLLL